MSLQLYVRTFRLASANVFTLNKEWLCMLIVGVAMLLEKGLYRWQGAVAWGS